MTPYEAFQLVQDTMSYYQPMAEKQTEMLMAIFLAESQDKESFDKTYKQNIAKKDFICQIMEKRIEAFKLPKFEPSAVVMLSVLAQGNPGKSVIALIETLEAHDKDLDKTIDAAFISTSVYPFGFYTDKAFEEVWDKRKIADRTGYNKLI